jgi:hypothetical protein
MRALWLLLLSVVLAAGCEGGDSRPATWSYISTSIIQPNCATSRCHSAVSAVQGLELDTLTGGYVVLTGGPAVPGQRPAGSNLVVPGDPTASRLMTMLHGTEAERMPPDEPLPQADIELIEQWILDGAKFD